MSDNNKTPSTPSWMTDNRRRPNRRGYGRRYSGVGSAAKASGVRSTATKVNRRRDSALFGPDKGEDCNCNPLDRSANARLEGRRRPPRLMIREDGLGGNFNELDRSARSSLRSRSNDGLDLNGEFEHISKPKKKRPNLPRPPRAAAARNRSGAVGGKKNRCSPPKVKPNPSTAFVFEPETAANTSSHSSSAASTLGSQDHPISLLEDGNKIHSSSTVSTLGSQDNSISLLEDDNKIGARGGGDAKRSKVMPRRSNSTAAAISASNSSPLFEENVHPNGRTEKATLSPSVGTRRSSRLRKARRASVASESTNDNKTATFVTTRSRTKGNSKKRSAAPDTSEQQVQQSPPNLRSPTTASTSLGGSFSSSTPSTLKAANGSAGSESFSSLAQHCSDETWASGPGSKCANNTKRCPKVTAVKKSYPQHKGSVSVTSFAKIRSNSNSGSSGVASAAVSRTPSSNNTLHNRSISCGGDPSLAGNNRVGFGSDSFLSPGGGETISTPPSTSSRKRSCMDFICSSPTKEDYIDLGGSERVARSKRGPPPRFLMNAAKSGRDDLSGSERVARPRKGPPPRFLIGHMKVESEIAPPSLKRISSEPVVAGTTAIDIFSSPQKTSSGNTHNSSFGNTLINKMSFVGSNYNGITEDKKGDARDRLSSNDESMMSSESEGEECSSDSSDEEEDEDAVEIPREMNDAEVFETKSSYDDFKFLTKSLQKWSSQSSGKGHHASMGLNNGCLIAVPSNWTFEHRANFAKWATNAFGFRVGSVGGAGCGTFLRCGDADGREALVRLRRVLNSYKAGRLKLAAVGGGGGGGGINHVAAAKNIVEKSIQRQEKLKPKLPMKLSSMQPPSALSKKGPPTLPMSMFRDHSNDDQLTERMKGVTLDDTERVKSNTPTPGRNSSVPDFIRTMKLQPLTNKIKNTTLPCFRNSPTVESSGRKSGGSGSRPPRLSSESAIHGSDLLNQLHGGCGNSPSPLPNRFQSRIRERANRVLQPVVTSRLSKERGLFRSSSDRPMSGQHHQVCLKPFESPHPRTCLALETPSSRLDFGLETPMPKQVEHWGSRPIFGKDWGESVCCCDSSIDTCSQIFAKSWFTSEFYGNEELSAQYQMSLDQDDESSLFPFLDADANIEDNSDADREVASINRESLDEFPTESMSKKIGFTRCDSLGASALGLLNLDDTVTDFGCQFSPSSDRRRTMKLRKYARMSLCAATASGPRVSKLKRCHRLSEPPPKSPRSFLSGTPINSIVNSTAFSCVFSFLDEGALIHSATLVCTNWADASAEALGNLMLVSVGCDPSLKEKTSGDDCSVNEVDETASLDDQTVVTPTYSSVAKSMTRDWSYLMNRFPWAKFLSDGSFKRVYKVWNDCCGAYEAVSVMDVDAIDDLGNSDLVGTELAVSVLLSSVARRSICPNFVITRGVFTCQHEPPTHLWGCRDDASPQGTTYDGHNSEISQAPKPDQCGHYQYIRMELCQHGDIEEFIKNHPEKMLAQADCRNLLFQMAFALHVASDRFGLKHYDVKLLNFFLQSAKDQTIADEDHPHVVLRYGVGSHVFRLRMHPSCAHIAKLADYGTSVMRTDTDGQPVSLGQFTTLENTPPDYLILGNEAEQGYGHDCFGLGLCMLHLFTGHAPYEEILGEVVCPTNLKEKLGKVWKQRSHNVIRSVMFDNDGNGIEIEDKTLYDTLYRYLVLFGVGGGGGDCITENQFGANKHQRKVWNAINTTLNPPTRSRRNRCSDIDVFKNDRKKFSLSDGTDKRIANARRRLQEMDGAMELLLSLVSFNPKTRATPLDVINSQFMSDLIEHDDAIYCNQDMVKSFTAYLTK